jgi:hypothetical protein
VQLLPPAETVDRSTFLLSVFGSTSSDNIEFCVYPAFSLPLSHAHGIAHVVAGLKSVVRAGILKKHINTREVNDLMTWR